MSHENEINEARALCFDVHTDCLWVVSLIETKMKKSIVVTICSVYTYTFIYYILTGFKSGSRAINNFKFYVKCILTNVYRMNN